MDTLLHRLRRMPALPLTACCAFALVCSAMLVAADRPAIVINPEGSPVWLDSQRSIFFDSPAVAVMIHNEHSEPVNYALRIWIFDERSRLKGTQDYCTFDVLGSHTRGRILIPLDFRGVTMRDRAVVAVTAVKSGRIAWTLRQAEADQLSEALAASKGSPGRLTADRAETATTTWTCPCECAAIEALCNRSCAETGRAGSSCTRTFDAGCAAICTCKQ